MRFSLHDTCFEKNETFLSIWWVKQSLTRILALFLAKTAAKDVFSGDKGEEGMDKKKLRYPFFFTHSCLTACSEDRSLFLLLLLSFYLIANQI